MKNKNPLERLIFKVTSGRFIFTIVVAGVYAYLSCTGGMSDERINEITLIVLYAYFNRQRPNSPSVGEVQEEKYDKDKTDNAKPM